jgi:hypothetical protein
VFEFRWERWNVDHIGEHGISPEQAEYLINRAGRGFPRYIGDGKFLVQGQDQNGMWMQAIFTMSPADMAFVIHARPLTDPDKHCLRRKRK